LRVAAPQVTQQPTTTTTTRCDHGNTGYQPTDNHRSGVNDRPAEYIQSRHVSSGTVASEAPSHDDDGRPLGRRGGRRAVRRRSVRRRAAAHLGGAGQAQAPGRDRRPPSPAASASCSGAFLAADDPVPTTAASATAPTAAAAAAGGRIPGNHAATDPTASSPAAAAAATAATDDGHDVGLPSTHVPIRPRQTRIPRPQLARMRVLFQGKQFSLFVAYSC